MWFTLQELSVSDSMRAGSPLFQNRRAASLTANVRHAAGRDPGH